MCMKIEKIDDINIYSVRAIVSLLYLPNFLDTTIRTVAKELPDIYYSTKAYEFSTCEPSNFTIDHGGFGGRR